MQTSMESRESHCPHYERDTCLIHFKCCPEERWYPCHKCHNEAVALYPNDQALQGNGKPLEHTVLNDTARGMSDTAKERRFGEAQETSEHEECPIVPYIYYPTGDGVEETLPAETETKHSFATALDGTLLKCTKCKQEQKFSKCCESCNKMFAEYFCEECKLLIEQKVDAYHCQYCGICRGNKADHFHCHGCSVCMSQSLKDNHKCFADRGHDPCAICYEEVFFGAIIFPCFHMVHKDCAEKLILSGSRICPICRGEIFQNGEYLVAAENTNNSNLGTFLKSTAKCCWRKLKDKLCLFVTG